MKGLGFFRMLGSMIADALDPVCQNPDAVLFTDYRGILIRLVPVIGENGHIDAWVNSPDEVARVDRLRAEPPDAPPSDPGETAPPPLPDFDPAGVPGL